MTSPSPREIANALRATPGPWKCVLPEGQGYAWVDRSDTEWGSIATCWSGDDNSTAATNAHLIATAPDLYAALSDLLIGYETLAHRLSLDADLIATATKFTKEVLAKARGETP